MNFDNYLFRCHSLGYIMMPGRGKTNLQRYTDAMISRKQKIADLQLLTDKAVKTKQKLSAAIDKLTDIINTLDPIKDDVVLSETAKTHLCDIFTAEKYGRHEDVVSKYLEKGLHMEEDAITLLSLVTQYLHKKNNERKSNEWITGEVDVEEENCINDTKVNWSIFQFNRLSAKPVKPIYQWQIKGYMWLWDKDNGNVVFCLLDTPEHLLKSEIRKVLFQLLGRAEFVSDEERDLYQPAVDEVINNHTYKDIPLEERVKIFKFTRDADDENQIKRHITAARKFLNELNANRINVEELPEEW